MANTEIVKIEEKIGKINKNTYGIQLTYRA